jgi:hypothetical protein
MTYSMRYRRRWLRRLVLGLAALAIAAPAAAQAAGGLAGEASHRPAKVQAQQPSEQGCRPPVGCPTSGLSAADASNASRTSDPSATVTLVDTPGIDWLALGAASGAVLVLLVALITMLSGRGRLGRA